jgi:hypothetical protein
MTTRIDPNGDAALNPPDDGIFEDACVCGYHQKQHGHEAITSYILSEGFRAYHPIHQETWLRAFVKHLEGCDDGDDCTAYALGGCDGYEDSQGASEPDPDRDRD